MMKKWLASLILGDDLKWLAKGAQIEKKDLNVATRYWFGFIINVIILSKNV